MTKNEQKWLVLLFSLKELHGGDKRSIVLNYINNNHYWYKNDHNDVFLESRNELVWRNDFSYERQHLVEKGYMKHDTQGRWEITPNGLIFLNNLISKVFNINFKKYYTVNFFKKINQNQEINEIEEDQILIDNLSNLDNNFDLNQNILLNQPIPIDSNYKRTKRGSSYMRSAAISKRALDRANNLCEIDPSHKSFIRKNTNKLYMEPHHLIPMKLTDYYGVVLDREQNIFSLCSNCHNQIHYGKDEDIRSLLNILYKARKEEINSIIGKDISIEELYEIYNVKTP